jgi:hypothetical protein
MGGAKAAVPATRVPDRFDSQGINRCLNRWGCSRYTIQHFRFIRFEKVISYLLKPLMNIKQHNYKAEVNGGWEWFLTTIIGVC